MVQMQLGMDEMGETVLHILAYLKTSFYLQESMI